MPYRFVPTNDNYADFAAGHVFYGAPGRPALPVRLTREIFLRCQAQRRALGSTAPAVIYDPCCGGAYHLSTLAYWQGADIAAIFASDVDLEMVAVAERNLGLLTPAGLAQRAAEIDALRIRFGKASHREAAAAARRLNQTLAEMPRPIAARCFAADATSRADLAAGLAGTTVDVVIADVPYGRLSQWQTDVAGHEESFVTRMLTALLPQLTPTTVVAIVADKGQRVAHAAYTRAGRFQIGKRRITLLRVTSRE